MNLYRIILRPEWAPRHDDGFGSAPLPASEVWLHHSVTIAPDLLPPFDDDYAAIRTLEQIGESRFGRGISYTWVISPAGLIFEGHGVGRQGSHTGGRNSIARAICWLGNYDISQPTEQQVRSTAWLLQHAHGRGWIGAARLDGGHRQAPGASTACPGRYGMATINRINTLAAGGPVQEDDMSAEDLLNAKLIMRGAGNNKETTVRTLLEWDDNKAVDLANRITKVDTELDEIRTILARIEAKLTGGV